MTLHRRDPAARKWCSGCKEEHPLRDFGWNKSAKDDRQHCCREWRAQRERELRNGAPPLRPWGNGDSMSALCRRAGINIGTFRTRLLRGWSVERALSVPTMTKYDGHRRRQK